MKRLLNTVAMILVCVGCLVASSTVSSQEVDGYLFGCNITVDRFGSDNGHDQFWVYLGSTPGGREYVDSGLISDWDNNTGKEFNGVPINGDSVYVTLWTRQLGAVWQSDTVLVDAFDNTDACNNQPILEPVDSQAGEGVMTWDSSEGSAEYWVHVGSVSGQKELYDSGSLSHGTEFIEHGQISGVHWQRLWYRNSRYQGDWKYIDRQSPWPAPALLPVEEYVIDGSSVTFEFYAEDYPGNGPGDDGGLAVNSRISDWWVFVGTEKGQYDILNSMTIPNNPVMHPTHEDFVSAGSITVDDIPVDGSPVHVRVFYYSIEDSKWLFYDRVYQTTVALP